MEEKTLLEMNGTAEHIVFRNEKNQYTVLEMNTGDELVTVVGIMPFVNEGEELHVVGTWSSHPSFGMQFKADVCERSRPETVAAMIKYLSSGAIKGIGAVTAGRIVEMFGEKSLDVIEKEPERLTSVKGITKDKAKKISEEFQKIYGIKEIIMALGKYGITPEETVKIWKQYGTQAVQMVEEDPYCLCSEQIGIGFERADRIADLLQTPRDNSCRVQAGVLYVLHHNVNNGHTCLPREKLEQVASKMLEVEKESAQAAVRDLIFSQELVSEPFGKDEVIFLRRFHDSEVYIANRLFMMLKYPPQPIEGVEENVVKIESEQGITYAAEQKQAIVRALEKGMLILTGGPGTGKTTTLKAIIRILKNRGETVFLAAPTGRAAKRMAELTGEEAKTIHRMLKVEWDEHDIPNFTCNEKNPLECDTVIVDELSMVDTLLFEGLLRAIPIGCRMILVGDCDQLPSVGAGNVLASLIDSELFPTVQLKEIFRQSEESLIVTNAHRIVNGENPKLRVHSSDFFFLPLRNPTDIQKLIVDLNRRRLPLSYGYSPLQDIQVITPGRKGELGTLNLNVCLQEALNPPDKKKKEITVMGSILREGDKVMQTRNDYNLPWTKEDGTAGEGAFNGDVGILVDIDRAGGSLTVQMDDRLVLYDFEHASELELAYAMTVHKSQGNEFPAVIMPVFPCAPQLCYRNLLYTAITRAKSLLILVGHENTVYKMIENDRRTKRYSGLYSFLTGDTEHVTS